ncbi:MAG: helix-turn-helix transcriptional regulator [Nannocystaceae bacterium]
MSEDHLQSVRSGERRGPPLGGRRRARMIVAGVEIEVFSEGPPALDQLGLTGAEREVARLLLVGASNAEIAASRGRSPRTVEKQVASCLRRLGVGSRAELLARLRTDG